MWSMALIILVASRAPASPADGQLSAFHAQTREAVRDVLAEREFAELQRDKQPPWWARWVFRTIQAVRDFFNAMPAWLLWTILIWMVLTLVAIAGHLLYVLLQSVGAVSCRASVKRRALDGELLGIRELEFDSVYARSQQLLAAGDWAAAARYLYVAAILWLDRRGRIVFRISKTNRDYQRELASHPPAHGPFESLTTLFDRAVYRGDQPDARLCGQMHALLQRIQNADASPPTR